jgi:hypothetical protein
MQKLSRLLTALALPLAIAGCAGSGIPIPLTEDGALKAFKPIANSSQAPCAMQKDVAEHNSAYDTLKTKQPVSYKAPCEVDKKKPEAKTS